MFRSLIVGALGAYRATRMRWLGLRGRTEDDVHAQRIVSGQAWDEYCDTLKAAGASLVHGDAPLDPFSQAEGYRYLARLTRAGLEAFIDNADPEFPTLRRMVHETVKMGADNPDNAYYNAQIDGRYRYRIQGKRGTVHYLGFGTQKGSYAASGGLQPSGYLEASDLHIEPDGSFEILLAKDAPTQGNWLKTDPETNLLIVRQTFLDRVNEAEATLQIVCIDGPEHPSPLSPAALDKGLGQAAALTAGASMMFARWANEFRQHKNRLPRFDQARSDAAGGVPDICYYHSYWELAHDEALVIESAVPDCDHWNFQLNNWWMESLDYRHFRIHVNKHTARYRADGSVRVIVAHTDPGRDNWIQTVGHQRGTMCWRWTRPQTDTPPEPQCRVLPMRDLQELPE